MSKSRKITLFCLLTVICVFGLFACAQKADEQTPNPDGQIPTVECTHSYGQWVSDGDSTHSHKCSKCGKTETQAHKISGDKCGDCDYVRPTETHTEHSFTNYVYNNDATCTADGTETAKCDGCNERDTRIKENTKLRHSFTDYQSNNDWTCTQDGTKTAKYDRCNERDTIVDIGSAKHMPQAAVKENEVAPTYETNGGYDLVVRCYKCNETISTEHITVDKLVPSGTEIHSKSLTVEDDRIYGKFANGTDMFRFAGDITVADGARYYLCSDILGTQVIPTKIAPLQSGDNVFYIVVENGNDDPMTYTVTLRVRPMYTVSFNTNSGAAVVSQTVEEDDYAVEPTTSRIGYTFDSWDYDFTQPIVENTRISASWTANTYTVTLDVNGGDDLERSEISIDYDDYFTFATPTRTGYTFNGWYDGETKVSSMTWKYAENKTFVADWRANRYYLTLTNTDTTAGTIPKSGYYYYDDIVSLTATNKDGYNFEGWYDSYDNLLCENAEYEYTMGLGTTLVAKWDYYTVTTEINYSAAGKVTTVFSSTKISAGKSVTVTATDNQYLGYTWLGWYNDNNELISNELSYTFTMAKENVTCTATWQVWTGLEVFDFTSTQTVLKITELKDKTLTEVVIPNSVTDIGGGVFSGCDNLASITVQDGNDKYHSDGNCIIDTVAKKLVAGCKNSVIPDDGSVTRVDGSAFSGCSSLTSITIPDSVTSIGSWAFHGCSSLTSITIPNSVTSIGSYAFYKCSSLTSITIPFIGNTSNGANDERYGFGHIFSEPSDGNNAVPSSLKTVIITGGSSINNRAFYGCTRLTSVEIPNGVTSIGRLAFYYCSSLTIYCEAASMHSDWDYQWNNSCCPVVWDCKNNDKDKDGYAYSVIDGIRYNLKNGMAEVIDQPSNISGSITIPSSVTYKNETYRVTSIGDEAFLWCNSLTSITIPNSVTSIGKWAFDGCSSLTSIAIPNSVTSIGSEAFDGCSSLTSIAIPNGVTSIGDRAFYGCTSLTSISIPNGVTSIGDRAFYECRNLMSVTFADESQLTSIGDWAFYCCSSLTSIEMPNSVTTVGGGVFYGCSKLRSAILSNQISQLEKYISNYKGYGFFENCYSLTSIEIPDSVTSIYNSTFKGCSGLTSVTLPFVGSTKDGTGATYFGCIFGAQSYNENNKYVPSSLKTVIITGGSSISDWAFYGCRIKNITILSVTSIGAYTFYDCSSLTSITIPNSVTRVGFMAFYNTAYYNNESNWENGVLYIDNHLIVAKQSISGTYTVKQGTFTIADYAFDGCSSLTSIAIPNSVTSIGHHAFYFCRGLTRIEIPISVTRIGSSSFSNCSKLTTITIPDSVTSIGGSAFQGCSNLTSITYNGTATQWKAISKSSGWNNETGEYTVYCIGENLSKSQSA